MKSIGLYRLILHPGTDPTAFERHVAENVGDSVWDTRLILNGMSTRFMRDYEFGESEPNWRRQYVWETMMDVRDDQRVFDFAGRTGKLQDIIRDFATVTAVDTLAVVSERADSDA